MRRFDRVVVATHADEALALLADPTAAERAALGAFAYSANETVLHTDALAAAAHTRARARRGTTCSTRCDGDAARVHVSYDMNRLQRLDEPIDYVVTLNGGSRIDDDTVLARMTLHAPDVHRRVGRRAGASCPR